MVDRLPKCYHCPFRCPAYRKWPVSLTGDRGRANSIGMVTDIIDRDAWMAARWAIHGHPVRRRRIAAHARELGLSTAGYLGEVNDATADLLDGARIGTLMTPSRLRRLLSGLPAELPEQDDDLGCWRERFEGELFREPHRVSYALLFDTPGGIPADLRHGYGDLLVELCREQVLHDATVTLGDTVVEGETLCDEHGVSLLARPTEILFDFHEDPLEVLDDRRVLGSNGGAYSYYEVQIHRRLVPGDVLRVHDLSASRTGDDVTAAYVIA